MILVVNDACLLIDLIDIDLFDEFLQLDFEAYVTSSVLNELEGDEYEAPIRQSIDDRTLSLYKLTADDQKEIEILMGTHSSKLSEPDCSCIHLAKKINATLLTCERLLTKTARNLKVEVHGSLWVLDRLPKDECKKRLKLWV